MRHKPFFYPFPRPPAPPDLRAGNPRRIAQNSKKPDACAVLPTPGAFFAPSDAFSSETLIPFERKAR